MLQPIVWIGTKQKRQISSALNTLVLDVKMCCFMSKQEGHKSEWCQKSRSYFAM